MDRPNNKFDHPFTYILYPIEDLYGHSYKLDLLKL